MELIAGGGSREDQTLGGTESDAEFPSGCYYLGDGNDYYAIWNNAVPGEGDSDSQPLCVSTSEGFVTGGTLFVGDSDIDLWATNANFAGSYNVGIGGHTCLDVLRKIDGYLSTFAPSVVILVCGENDLGAGSTVSQTFARFSSLVDKIESAGARAVYLGTKPEPATASLHSKYRQYDAQIRSLTSCKAGKLAMIDVYAAFESLGNPNSLYASDKLHLSSGGYSYWTTWATSALDDASCLEWRSGVCVTPLGNGTVCDTGGTGGTGGDETAPSTTPEASDDAPCFSWQTEACRILDPAATAAAAYEACFGGDSSGDSGAEPFAGPWSVTATDGRVGASAATAAAAQRVRMAQLSAGDLVLADPTAVTHVVVAQHSASESLVRTSAMLTLHHTRGSLTVTPDHVLFIDGRYAAARHAAVGSALSSGAVVTAVAAASDFIINPITARGTILAAGPEGLPVLAATGNEWTADILLSASPRCSASYALAYLFPATAQAYYDAALEPLFNAIVPALATAKAAAPAPLVVATLGLSDLLLAAGLAAFTLAQLSAALLPSQATRCARLPARSSPAPHATNTTAAR